MKLYQKSELKSSRIFYDKKTPTFLTVFIIFVVIIFTASVWVSSWMSKTYIVEAMGTITTEDNIYVTSLSDGVVADLKVKEGMYVKKGDILLELSSGNNGIQYQAIQKQLDDIKNKISAIDKFIESLNKASNQMTKNGIEEEYYEKVNYYLSIISEENNNKESNQEKVNKKLQKKNRQEEEIQKLNNEINMLDNSEDNKLRKEELLGTLESKNAELESLTQEIEDLNRNGASQAEQTKIQMISEAGSSRTALQSNLIELEGQMKAYQSQDALTTITANNEGYVHYLSSAKVGINMQKGQTVAEISTNSNELMLVEAYIQASDISKVKINDNVNVSINGVNSQKYGMIPGKLISIDSGTLTQESDNGNIVLYRCIISLKKKNLVSSDGDEINIVKSMPVVSRIVYEKETYLDWVLELLNFKN